MNPNLCSELISKAVVDKVRREEGVMKFDALVMDDRLILAVQMGGDRRDEVEVEIGG